MRAQRFRALLSIVAIISVLGSVARAATVPSGFTEALIASGLSSPTAMQFAPDGRLFVCEQTGRLRVIKDGALLSTPFLTLSVSSVGERGLLGVAFDPAFATNRFVYVYYTTASAPIHNRISRFTANGDVAVPGSGVVILELDNLSIATNHNGGALAFGPDGKLYAAVGENANGANAQSMNNLLGKILRINKDGTIPGDNPFFSTATGRNRAIWALGLRNPFTFAFNPSGPEMFINDVGQKTWEEINDGERGANYGWPTTEGTTTDPRFVSPRYVYNHTSGRVRDYRRRLLLSPLNPISQRVPQRLLLRRLLRRLDSQARPARRRRRHLRDRDQLSRGSEGVGRRRLVLSRARDWRRDRRGLPHLVTARRPSISSHPASRTVAPGASVTFSVRASGQAPLQYRWQRNGANIAGATAPDYRISSVSQADNGARFRAVVSNAAGSVTSNQAVLTVSANRAPTATITQPAAGLLYRGGMVINYSGKGTDPEQGNLPASAFTWRVDFHHDAHTHPFIQPRNGATGGSFTIPTTGHTETNVWYRIYLTVRDSGGLTHTTHRDIRPRKVQLTLATNPAGLRLRLDGQPVTTPLTFQSVVGVVRNLGATSPQASGGSTYQFASWSDGGAATHNISTPAANRTYSATYRVSSSGTGSGLSVTYFNNANLTGTTVTRD